MVDFINTERDVEKLFPIGSLFYLQGKKYQVILSGKPRPSSGECKTDVYVLGRTCDGEEKEIKLSVKQNNADFLENKISLNRAYEIFGENAPNIIKQCLLLIKDEFLYDYLICFKRYKKTEAHTIKLGWKFELVNKISGQKSGIIQLSDEQKFDVYAGVNLSEDKRNCYVKDKIVKNSGIANYILIIGCNKIDTKECLTKMQPIESYAKSQTIYFACKALNYRFDKNKWDGPSPLSAYVDWSINNGKLDAKLILDQPLVYNGNEIGYNLIKILRQLNIKKFDDLKSKLSPNIKYYPEL